MKKILVVAHAPSQNTQAMVDAVIEGICHPELSGVTVSWLPPLQAQSQQVIECDGIILGTTENLGYMSGALKDFFDRIYYPCLELCQGKPMATFIRAGHDGTGTKRAIDSICTGLKWRPVMETLICRGPWQEDFLPACQELGTTFAAGLEAGIF
ncbi:flavodoxin family protein [Halioxenophilus sp. WMMB6]|uniref:flavodoxin family protein n=1 Tax=Halioxenophilus sp. WMMB6 TaxID=3073815 RepID=UPI00295E3BD4|nr:NAD(P)H-dependent oxidoreductase [Halioxenophilus sp. WMMB6]